MFEHLYKNGFRPRNIVSGICANSASVASSLFGWYNEPTLMILLLHVFVLFVDKILLDEEIISVLWKSISGGGATVVLFSSVLVVEVTRIN